MAVVCAAGAWLAGLIASAYAAVAQVVSYIVTAIVAAVTYVYSAIIVPMASSVATTVTHFTQSFLVLSSRITTYTANAIESMTIKYFKLQSWVEATYEAFHGFLRAIHYKTLLEIHTLAFILSEDYRDMMQKVYGKISELSEALGFAPQFIALALRNARALVLDASTAMGKRYDLAEVAWLSNLKSFMEKVGARAGSYERNPAKLFNDLDDWVIEPAQDAKAETQLTIFTTLNTTLKQTENLMSDVVTVRDDLDRFVSQMPASMRIEIEKYTDPIIETFDEFRQRQYGPAIDKLDQSITVLTNNQQRYRDNIDNIVDRLRFPGDILGDVDSLNKPDRIDQEDKISDISNRKYNRDVADYTEEPPDVETDLQAIVEAIEYETTPPEVLQIEPKTVTPKEPQDAEKRETWFVGDY